MSRYIERQPTSCRIFYVNDSFQEELSFRLNEVKGNLWPILLKNSFSGSSKSFLAVWCKYTNEPYDIVIDQSYG